MTRNDGRDQDEGKGAVEGDRPEDSQQGNANVSGFDDEGLPANPTATAEDRIGANVDHAERDDVANADERGRTTDSARDELKPLG